MRDKLFEPRQPSLEEMLSDPIVWMVMKSDGVDEYELRSLLKRVAADLVVGRREHVRGRNHGGAWRRLSAWCRDHVA